MIAASSCQRIRHYVELAHEQCYVANSLRAEVVVEPELVRR